LDIANGMINLHHVWMLHRDLKSLNVLLKMENNEIRGYVCDFGESVSVKDIDSGFVECPFWLPPEVISNRKWSTKSDVYAFGVILWEMSTRKRPYDGKFAAEVQKEIISGKRLSMNRSSPLKGVVEMCWKQEPEERPEFTEIYKVLKAL
ncbi:tyrosine protein kinase receptor Tie-1, putative, partial [Entamoeba invadens IP1]